MQVTRIDHVHIEVSDRDTAAKWYNRVLGLNRHPDFERWADDPMGPLILVGGDGFPTLSLFARDCGSPSRDTTIAFRVDGESFVTFCTCLEELDLSGKDGSVITQSNVVDHDLSWSLYFVDADQNRIEVTTYDYDFVASTMPSKYGLKPQHRPL